jgi:hypothetical protein
MKQLKSNPVQSPFNKEVKTAHQQILKQARSMLSTIEREELRFTLVREDKYSRSKSCIIHEMVNPLLYLRLESDANGEYAIHYGYEPLPVVSEYYPLIAAFVRFIYTVTMSTNRQINIESALRLDWVIYNASEMYEHVEDRDRHHSFQLIKYKPAASKRKQMKAA